MPQTARQPGSNTRASDVSLYLEEKNHRNGIALGCGSRRGLQEETPPRAGGFNGWGRTSARQDGQQQQQW